MNIDWSLTTKNPISRGSSRDVYGYGSYQVLKIPRKAKLEQGEEQNNIEASIYEIEKFFKPYLAKVFAMEYIEGECILVAERLKPLANTFVSLQDYLVKTGLSVPFTMSDINSFAERHSLYLSELLQAHLYHSLCQT